MGSPGLGCWLVSPPWAPLLDSRLMPQHQPLPHSHRASPGDLLAHGLVQLEQWDHPVLISNQVPPAPHPPAQGLKFMSPILTSHAAGARPEAGGFRPLKTGEGRAPRFPGHKALRRTEREGVAAS